jgi:hypothetical protein
MCTCATRGCVFGSTFTCVVDASAGLHSALLLCVFSSVCMVLQQQGGMVGHPGCKVFLLMHPTASNRRFVCCLTRDTSSEVLDAWICAITTQ